jgi:hypothetical protein
MSRMPDQDERDDEDELTDEEWAEMEADLAEAKAHPEGTIPHEEVVPRRAKLAG